MSQRGDVLKMVSSNLFARGSQSEESGLEGRERWEQERVYVCQHWDRDLCLCDFMLLTDNYGTACFRAFNRVVSSVGQVA